MCEISFIIPVYNKKEYLKRCLDSILKCSGYSFEIILVDDGSTDGSLEMIEKLNHPRIKLIKNSENKGAYATRQIGSYAALGDYIMFVDADDYIDASALLEAKPYIGMMDVIHFPLCFVSDTGVISKAETPEWSPAEKTLYGEDILNELLEFRCGPKAQYSRLIKRELVLKTYNSLNVKERLYLVEDHIFTFVYAYFAESYQPMKTVLYYYVYIEGSSSNAKATKDRLLKDIEQFKKVYKILEDFFIQNHLDPFRLFKNKTELYLWKKSVILESVHLSVLEKKELSENLAEALGASSIIEGLYFLYKEGNSRQNISFEEQKMLQIFRRVMPQGSFRERIARFCFHLLKKLF